MAVIERGFMHIKNFKQGDRLYLSFEVIGYDLTDKELAMDIKRNGNSSPLVRFSSEATPPTIFSTYNAGEDKWFVTLDQTSLVMKALRPGSYVFDIEAYSTDEDTQTFIDGRISVVAEITKRDK